MLKICLQPVDLQTLRLLFVFIILDIQDTSLLMKEYLAAINKKPHG